MRHAKLSWKSLYPFILALFCMTGCSQHADDHSFSFRPDTAKTYHVVKTIELAQNWNYDGKPQHVDHYTQTAFRLKVLDHKDSIYTVKLTFDRFVIKELKTDTGQPIPTEQDLQNDPRKLWDYLLHFTKGLSVNVWIDNHGQVRNVQGAANVLDSVATVSGKERSIVRAYLRDYISKEAIQDQLTELFCFAPAIPKTNGQSWITDMDYYTKAPVHSNNRYVLKSLQGDTAVMTVTSLIAARQGQNGKMYMKGKLTGDIGVRYSTGIPYSYMVSGEMVTTTDHYEINNKVSVTCKISDF